MRALGKHLPITFIAIVAICFSCDKPADVPQELSPKSLSPEPPPKSLPELQRDGIQWLMSIQNSDGSWGPEFAEFGGRRYERSGITGIAVLVFLGQHYGHLSIDMIEGRKVGDAEKAGLDWLIKHPATTDLGKLQSTLALLETYGLTGVNWDGTRRPQFGEAKLPRFQEILTQQAKDGSWGKDLTKIAWAARGMHSAILSGVPFPAEPLTNMCSYLDTRFEAYGEPQVAALRLMTKRISDQDEMEKCYLLILENPPDSESTDFDYSHVAGVILKRDQRARNMRVMRNTDFSPWFNQLKQAMEAEILESRSDSDDSALIRRLLATHALTALNW